MDYRDNFHEDDLKHYLLKMRNAKADGKPVGVKPRKKASKASLAQVLENPRLDWKTRAKISKQLGKQDVLGDFLANLTPEKRKLVERFIQECG